MGSSIIVFLKNYYSQSCKWSSSLFTDNECHMTGCRREGGRDQKLWKFADVEISLYFKDKEISPFAWCDVIMISREFSELREDYRARVARVV